MVNREILGYERQHKQTSKGSLGAVSNSSFQLHMGLQFLQAGSTPACIKGEGSGNQSIDTDRNSMGGLGHSIDGHICMRYIPGAAISMSAWMQHAHQILTPSRGKMTHHI